MAWKLNRKVWIDDDGSGLTGTPIKNATLQGDIYDPVDAALGAAGLWQSVPHALITYGASAGTWTVPSEGYYFAVVNGICYVQFACFGSTLGSGIGLYLTISPPPGITIALAMYNAGHLIMPGVAEWGLTMGITSPQQLRVTRTNENLAFVAGSFTLRAIFMFGI